MANNKDLRELYPSPYGQPREKVPGANAWFTKGGKVFGQQLSPETQNALALIAEFGLAGGPAIKVSKAAGKSATSAIDNIIASNTGLDPKTYPSYEGGGLLGDFIRQTKARNKKSVENIAKGPTGKELEEARRWTPGRIDKQLRRDDLDKKWYDAVDEEMWHTERSQLAKEFANEKNIHRVPREVRDDLWIQKYLDELAFEESPMDLRSTLQHLDIGKWKPMTLDRMIDQVNRTPLDVKDFNLPTMKGGNYWGKGSFYGPELTRPQYTTPSRGRAEEIARKANLLTRHDVDYRDIPAFVRRHIDNDLLR